MKNKNRFNDYEFMSFNNEEKENLELFNLKTKSVQENETEEEKQAEKLFGGNK